MAPDNYRVTGSPHYQEGEYHEEGDIVADVPESLLRRFPDKFEEVESAEAQPIEDDEDEGSDEPSDPDEAEAETETRDDVAEPGPGGEPATPAEATSEQEPEDEPDAPSGIPDDHTTLRRIASQNDLGEGVDGRSSSADIVAALKEIPEEDRDRILSETELDSEG